jgi:polyphenol oxidase
MKFTTIDGVRYLMSATLAAAGAGHAFGTRELGRDRARVHARIKAAFPAIEEIAVAHQVHGRRVLRAASAAEAAAMRAARPDADAIVTAGAGVAAAVRTADCTPVLVWDRRRRVGAAVHAGWRGTAAGAAGAAVAALVRDYGSDPAELAAAIGPCIGPCHYQVDEPVIAAMEAALGPRAGEVLDPDGPGHARLNLSRANRIILELAGVPAASIDEAGTCTYCHAELFFSYRREGKGVPSLYHFIYPPAEKAGR